jgi:uncharacterized phage protein (TIGR02220 family)
MAKDKKSFILYCDTIHTIEKLSDANAGQLFKHLLRYVNDQNPETDNDLVTIAFEPIKQQLKRDLRKFDEIREKRSQAGKAGADKKWQMLTNDGKAKQTIAKIADSDSDNDSDIYNINYQALLDFVNETFGRSFKLISEKVKKSYRARLKEGYSKDDIFNAIRNCKLNAYHKENNYQYCTPEFFSRADVLDKYSSVTTESESNAIVEHLKKFANVK